MPLTACHCLRDEGVVLLPRVERAQHLRCRRRRRRLVPDPQVNPLCSPRPLVNSQRFRRGRGRCRTLACFSAADSGFGQTCSVVVGQASPARQTARVTSRSVQCRSWPNEHSSCASHGSSCITAMSATRPTPSVPTRSAQPTLAAAASVDACITSTSGMPSMRNLVMHVGIS